MESSRLSSLDEFVCLHKGLPALVCGSGISNEKIKPFLNQIREKKIPIFACNFSYVDVDPDYLVYMDLFADDVLFDKAKKTFTKRGTENPKATYVLNGKDFRIFADKFDSHAILSSTSSIFSAMYLAYVMGASEILLSGADGYKKTIKETYSPEVSKTFLSACKTINKKRFRCFASENSELQRYLNTNKLFTSGHNRIRSELAKKHIKVFNVNKDNIYGYPYKSIEEFLDLR